MLQQKVRRFSVSLPPTLVGEFDETWRGMKYDGRPKAVLDARVAQLKNRATGKRDRTHLIEYEVFLINQGYTESTVESYHGMLKQLVKSGANLDEPESVKEAREMSGF